MHPPLNKPRMPDNDIRSEPDNYLLLTIDINSMGSVNKLLLTYNVLKN